MLKLNYTRSRDKKLLAFSVIHAQKYVIRVKWGLQFARVIHKMRFICKHAVLDLLTGLRYNEHNHEKVSVRKRLTVLVENFAHDDW